MQDDGTSPQRIPGANLDRRPAVAAGDPTQTPAADDFLLKSPTVNLPKGGGAIRGIGEKFSANPVMGTGAMSVPIALSPGRSGFGPQLALNYDSGSGQGIFGLGWTLAVPSIMRKTDKGLPRYRDAEESDVFMLSGAEDLVPVTDVATGRRVVERSRLGGGDYEVFLYRPRIEGLMARIERWTRLDGPAHVFWRSIGRDNVITWYGCDDTSQVCDPVDRSRIFQWLICRTCDDKGNAVAYDHVDQTALDLGDLPPWESNRVQAVRSTNRLLKRIRYGFDKPWFPTLDAEAAQTPLPATWMFEAVFDYGDHGGDFPSPVPDAAPQANAWLARSDAFSNYRPGFELRTWRLCRRVLMFHHFPEIDAVDANCLVRSTDFDYDFADAQTDAGRPSYATLHTVTQRSYQRRPKVLATDSGWATRELPPLVFNYSQPQVSRTPRAIDPDQLRNLPVGTRGPGYRWIDLDGEGLSGVLAQSQGAWYYKSGIGDGEFGELRVLERIPALASVSGGSAQLMDLAGDGGLDLVTFAGASPGFHKRDRDAGWKRHVPFASLPNIDWQDANLRFVDLTGDGRADVLVTEHDVFCWYASLDERGFDAAERQARAQDEDAGPRLVFADGTQTIFLADMSGDGLTDLVRLRNAEVCYWPNLGYGRFGRRITLGNPPCFDTPELFDPARIRLADIDGSGTIDLIYLGRDGARLYFNRSGNSLSDACPVDLPVATANLADVQVADLLGNGTACLVWNSHLPADAAGPVRYIDLMGGDQDTDEARREHRCHEKPHLLIGVDNSLGATTRIDYTPSTRFYVRDAQAGTPWATRLPFPVHCVSKITVSDHWRGTAFSSTYSYHHGYFDATEREFRGFGRVEQVDVEDYGTFSDGNVSSPWITADHTLYQPPVKTITWFDTGAAIDSPRVLAQFEQEYFPQRYAARLGHGPDDFRERRPAEPQLPDDLTGDEWLEALRACKSRVLRQETYELDIDDLAGAAGVQTPVRLYSVATHDCSVTRLQPRGTNAHAVFLVSESETVTYHHELPLPKDETLLAPDPRIAHVLNLRRDELGNPLQVVTIGYGRRLGGDPDLPRADLIAKVQGETHIAYVETGYTADVELRARGGAAAGQVRPVRHRRLRMACETLTFELSGIARSDGAYFEPADFLSLHLSDAWGPQLTDVPRPIDVVFRRYEQTAVPALAQRRIVAHARSLWFDDGDDPLTGLPRAPSAALGFGQLGPRGLKYEDYRLALTSELLAAVYRHVDDAGVIDDKLSWNTAPAGDLPRPAQALIDDPATSGYCPGPSLGRPAGEYWQRSGTAEFDATAAARFFGPARFIDPFGNRTTVEHDARDLFVVRVTDPMENVNALATDAAGPRFDYRVLAPIEVVDLQGNHSEVAFDIRGQVAAMAAKGKFVAGAWQGDHLDGWSFDQVNVAAAAISTLCLKRDFGDTEEQTLRQWLGTASARFVYHFGETRDTQDQATWRQAMSGACAVKRETHLAALAAGQVSDLQIALACSDGSGSVLMNKVQAEPAPGSTARRWLVNGLTILNNKGKPVKQYEPDFSDQFGCEIPQANGVTSIVYYDAAGRALRTEHPDGTFARVEFSPWDTATWDQNDTVLESDWYAGRLGYPPADPLPVGVTIDPQKRAAWLVARHAGTPALTLMDSLGRSVFVLAHNRVEDAAGTSQFDGRLWKDVYYGSFSRLDSEGKPLWVRDARGNLVMQYIHPAKPVRLADTPPNPDDPLDTTREYLPAASARCYDMAGNLLYQRSMDAGDRWMLMDAAGKAMLLWDFNVAQQDLPVPPAAPLMLDERRLYRTDYDSLHRPTQVSLGVAARQAGTSDAFVDMGVVVIERHEYQDAVPADAANLNGQLIRHYDAAGLVETVRRDFAGNVEEVHRQLVRDRTSSRTDWKALVDAGGVALLEDETYLQLAWHDALGRMTTLVNWHRAGFLVAVYTPQYNERGLLKSEALRLHAARSGGSYDPATGQVTQAIQEIVYDEKGRKTSVRLGNGSLTRYDYDPLSQRLRQILTDRPPPDLDFPAFRAQLKSKSVFQQLLYVHDPVGNIVECEDQAWKPVYFDGGVAQPRSLHEYDALYRLTQARGRETAQGAAAAGNGGEPAYGKSFPVTSQTLRDYVQTYVHDEVGNFVTMHHVVPSDPASNWLRTYGVALDSNRLSWTRMGTAPEVDHEHDVHGNMRNLAAVAAGNHLRWDHRDAVRALDLGGGGQAWYQYDSAKQRSRKFIQRSDTTIDERVYLGGLERFRRWKAGKLVEEIETLHLFEGEQRILMVDDVQQSDPAAQPGPDGLTVDRQTLFRYQYGNHLGSVSAELDDTGRIISYEEFHPYGTSACRALDDSMKAPQRRYRFTGMERDEESGLSCHGHRHLWTLTGNWISPDPTGIGDGLNLYRYARGNPIANADPSGGQTVGVMRDLAGLARRDIAEKMKLLTAMAHHPETYPTANAKTMGALRAEINALEKTAGSWEARADEHTDFSRHVSLPVAGGAAVLAVGAPAVLATSGATALAGTLYAGAGAGAALEGGRQLAQKADGTRSSMSGLDILESAGKGGALAPAAVAFAPVRVGMVVAGVRSGANELDQGHTATGIFDIATAVVPEAVSRAKASGVTAADVRARLDPRNYSIDPNTLGTPGGNIVFKKPQLALPGSRSATTMRNSPGTVFTSEPLPDITGRWLRGTSQNGGRVPGQIARQLVGRQFATFGDLRAAFWQLVAADPNLRSQFTPGQVTTMEKGNSPFVTLDQATNGGRAGEVYNLHHAQTIESGGGVYDLSALFVLTPAAHSGYH